MTAGNEIAKFVVRMPATLHAAVKDRAEKNRRSMNSEILVLLEAGMMATTTELRLPEGVTDLSGMLGDPAALHEALTKTLGN